MPHKDDHVAGGEQQIYAYNRMMERVQKILAQSDKYTVPAIRHAIITVQDEAIKAGELDREEAQRIGNYLLRDLEDAGDYLAETGLEFKDWLRFDIELIEDRILDMFKIAADQTKLELLALEQRAQRASEYHTGEVTGIGTLKCKNCGQLLHFHGVKHIPPCPHCHGAVYQRPGHKNP